MKKLIFSVIVYVLMSVNLFAQAIWQQDTIVQKEYDGSLDAGVLISPSGDIYSAYIELGGNECSLLVDKRNRDGELLWDQPRRIDHRFLDYTFSVANHSINLYMANDNCFYIVYQWFSGRSRIALINSEGNPVWQERYLEFEGNVKVSKDQEGGLFVTSTANSLSYVTRVSSTGVLSFPLPGVLISSQPGFVLAMNTGLDGDVLIATVTTEGQTKHIRVSSYDPDLNLNWVCPLSSIANSGNFVPSLKQKISPSDGSIYLLWTMPSGNQECLNVQRLSPNGSTVFPTPHQIMNSQASYIDYDAVITEDNSLLVCFIKQSGYITKISANGSSLWQPVLQSLDPSYTEVYALASDGMGGGYFAFRTSANYGGRLYAQRFHANGEPHFSKQGISLSETPISHVKLFDSPGMIIYKYVRSASDTTNVYYNTYSIASGEVGRACLINSFVSGLPIVKAIQKRLNDVVVVYQNHRGFNIKYQIVNQDGSLLFEPDGRTLLQARPVSSVKTAILENGNTVVLAGNSNGLFIQYISPSGDLLLREEDTQLHGNYVPKISDLSVQGNTFSFGYSEWDGVFVSWIQKMDFTEKLWGPQGIEVIVNLPYDVYSRELFDFKNGFAYLRSESQNPSRNYYHVLRYDDHGNMYPGWSDSGVMVFPYDMYYISNADRDRLEVYDNSLLVSNNSGRITLLNTDGETILYNHLPFGNNPQWYVRLTDAEESYMMLSDLFDTGIVYNKITPNGDFPWGPDGVSIVSEYNNLYPWAHKIVHLGQGRYLIIGNKISNSMYESIHYWLVERDGSYTEIGGNHGTCLFYLFGYGGGTALFATELNGSAFVAAHNKIGIWAQLIGTPSSSNEEQVAAVNNIINTFPNPFMGTVNISMQLPKAGLYELQIYNLRGQLIKSIKEESKSAIVEQVWEGKDMQGNSVGSGIYIIKAKTGKNTYTRKISLIR